MKRILSIMIALSLIAGVCSANLVYAKNQKKTTVTINSKRVIVIKGKTKTIPVQVGPKCRLKKISIAKNYNKRIVRVVTNGKKIVVRGRSIGKCNVEIKVKYTFGKKVRYKKFMIKVDVRKKIADHDTEIDGTSPSDNPNPSDGNTFVADADKDTDQDGISDAEERAYGTDPNKKDDTKTDTDGDGLTNYIEIYVTKTNINLKDTDGDQLSDFEETAYTYTDPNSIDSDKNGINDFREDPDKDNLNNGEEISVSSNPFVKDTDHDSLSDGEEVNRYRTRPDHCDTDGDGAKDGWEIENGFDPLKYNDSFAVTKRQQSAEGTVTASVEVECEGDPDSLKIEEVSEDDLLNEKIPGSLGNAFSFSTSAEFDKAEISFQFDTSTLNGNADPTIYYYNEVTQSLEELETTRQGNIVTAMTRHFSTYILIDKTTYEKVTAAEIMKPASDGGKAEGLDLVFAIDYSASMDDNDPEYQRLAIVKDFIEKFRDDYDRGAVVKFAAYATKLVPLTTDKEMLKNAVDGITNNNGDSCASNEAGTNGSDALNSSMEELNSSDGSLKYIIFLTDGEDTVSSYDYDDLIQKAKEENIVIYSIGMGDADEALLTKIAVNTGGKYYYANEVDEESENDLWQVIDQIEDETVDFQKDSNNDGISDYYTKLLCDGSLLSGTGTKIFEGIPYEEIQKNRDYDNDGAINGDELVIKYDETIDKTYVKVISSPSLYDTDEDGWNDKEDSQPRIWNVGNRDLAIFAALSYENGENLVGEMYTSSRIKGSEDETGEKYYFWNGASLNTIDAGIANKWKLIDYVNTWEDIDTYFSASTFKNGSNIVIAYRGTNEPVGEWVNNIVGVGLLDYHSEEGAAKKYALKIADRYPNSKIYITGHSLGGYLAQVGAAEILNQRAVNPSGIKYFNGIGLAYNPLLQWTKKTQIDALSDYYKKGNELVSYEIKGDVVSALGKHMGDEVSYYASSECRKHHFGQYGEGNITDFLSKSGMGWLCMITGDNLAHYYDYYKPKSIMEYFWITHETDSFLYHLSQGNRYYAE